MLEWNIMGKREGLLRDSEQKPNSAGQAEWKSGKSRQYTMKQSRNECVQASVFQSGVSVCVRMCV